MHGAPRQKICIHQADPELKKRGVAAINQFIRRSASLLVCHAGSAAPGQGYFERLWCVFELAAFVGKTRELEGADIADRLVVLPLWRPVCLLVLQLTLFAGHTLEYLELLPRRWSFCPRYVAQMSVGVVFSIWLDDVGEREKAELLRQLRTFRFDRVKCTVPEDRVQVRLAIEELYAGPNEARDERGNADREGGDGGGGGGNGGGGGIERFEREVQSGEVYHAVERAVGRQTGMLGPLHAGMAFLPNLLRAFSYFPHNRAAHLKEMRPHQSPLVAYHRNWWNWK